MSHLSKAGARFKPNTKSVPEFLRAHWVKQAKESALPFSNAEPVPPDQLFENFKEWKFFVGDRVLITKGPKKGTITEVSSYSRNENKIMLADSPSRKVAVPKPLWQAGTSTYVVEMPEAVSPDDLKLVVKMEDEATGKDKDVIIHKFEFRGNHFNKAYQSYMPTRIVRHKGEVLYLPWPAPANPLTRSANANEDVNSERTYFVDSVIHNQVPAGALSTIRNPRSKYRRGVFEQRHLNKFIAPEMPLSETKKAFLKEVKAKKNNTRKPGSEIKDFIGAKVKEYIDSQKKELGL